MGLFALLSIMTFGILGVLFVFWPIFGLISLAAIALLIYFCAQPGTPGPNEYGAVPPVWVPNASPIAPVPPPAAS
jgi:uncharacterized membrane protein YhaH (DUF805 family)